MQYVYAVFELIAGLGAFLLGVKFLSDNMEKLATARLRNLFRKTSKSKLVGVGIGTVTTAIVQSSSLTTVMVVGLVNAGVMSLGQATTVIMGANIGTTITGQIAALQAFDFAAFATALAGVGVLVAMFSKKEKVCTVAYAVAGLGLVFIGLGLMAEAMTLVKQSQAVLDLFASIENPFLLFFLGIAVTAIVQSSSAVTSILISMASAGIIIGSGGNSVLFVILGTNIGTCVTALISSIGANTNAKRAAVIHLLFNVIGSIIFFIILISWKDMMSMTLERWFPGLPSTQIAMFHTFFNVICTIIFLPFTNLFVKLSSLIVKERRHKGDKSAEEPTRLDKRLLATPVIAVDNATEEALDVLKSATQCLDNAVNAFLEQDATKSDDIVKDSEHIAERLQNIGDYLVQISAYDATLELEKRITALHSCIGDINRVGEVADNVTKYTRRAVKDGLHFSPKVKEEIRALMDIINDMSVKSGEVLSNRDTAALGEIETFENNVDGKRKELIKDHIKRLGSGECRPESSGVFINLVCNLERVGDHLNYIAHTVESV